MNDLNAIEVSMLSGLYTLGLFSPVCMPIFASVLVVVMVKHVCFKKGDEIFPPKDKNEKKKKSLYPF